MGKDLRLNVFHNGRQVGALAQLHGLIYFSYTAEWIASGFSISPRSLPLSNKAYQANGRYFEGLFGVFADSLPDGWGIRLAMRRLAEKGISYAALSPLEKLSYLGEDGLGGLNCVPCLAEENTQYRAMQYLETVTNSLASFEKCPVAVPCFFERIGRRNRKLLIHGYNYDDFDNTMSLFVCDYSGIPEMTLEEINAEIKEARTARHNENLRCHRP